MKVAEAPRVALALEGLETSPDLLPSVQRMRRLGAEVLLLTAHSSADIGAIAAPELLQATTVYGGLHTKYQKEAVLQHTGAWGYAGTSRLDMSAARKAGVRALALTESAEEPELLWRSGADTSTSLTNLPKQVKFDNDPSLAHLVRFTEFVQTLGINRSTVNVWASDGTIPVLRDAWGKSRTLRPYMDNILAYTGEERPNAGIARLLYWHWQYESGTYAQHRAIPKLLREQLEAGELYTPQNFAKLVGYTHSCGSRWIKTGFLKSVKIGGQHYLPRSEVSKKKAIMNGLTGWEVAERLGKTTSRVHQLHRAGKLEATESPNGLRFSPAAVKEFQTRPTEGGLEAPAVRAKLGINQITLGIWARRGVLSYIVRGRRYLYDEAQVQRVHEQRNRISPDFSWLPVDGEKDSCSTPRQTSERLQIRYETVLDWLAAGLLPSFNRAPEALGATLYDVPDSYIEGFDAFLAGRRGSAKLLREYRDAQRAKYGTPQETDTPEEPDVPPAIA